MPTPPVSVEVSLERRAAIESALMDGFSPYGETGGRGASVAEAGRRLGVKAVSLGAWVRRQAQLKSSGREHFEPDWTLYRRFRPPAVIVASARQAQSIRPPSSTGVKRWILTAAQDDTEVHRPFWENLLAYALHVGAEVMVGPFTYQKKLFSDHETRSGFFASEVRPYLRYDRADLGPILFCAEMNTLPTASRPLSGLESYSGQKWAVFPHAKIALVTVPTLVGAPAKHIMTTGCVTVPNFVAKKAGLKAEFHFCYGATLVEIDSAGRLFCRQINATDDGAFQDLDTVVRDGRVTTGHRVEGVTWGDIHRRKLDPTVAHGSWGLDLETGRTVHQDNLLDVLRPRFSFLEDLLDFEVRNHHTIDDPFHRFAMQAKGTDLVRDEVIQAARFVREIERDFCQQVIVYSNHDDALPRWIKTADHRTDPANAPYFLALSLALYQSIERGDLNFNLFRYALAMEDSQRLEGIDFVDDDSSYVICQGAKGGGVECGMHGHLGINGARGTAIALTKTAVKINRGHEHSPSIYDGVYTAGLSGLLDQGYNRGLSGWSHTHIVTYPSGKRTLVTLQDGRWRA